MALKVGQSYCHNGGITAFTIVELRADEVVIDIHGSKLKTEIHSMKTIQAVAKSSHWHLDLDEVPL